MARKANVQQQNAEVRAEILRAAQRGLGGEPSWLATLLSISGLDPSQGIVAQLQSVPDQEGNIVSGIWVSAESEFYRFEALEITKGAPDVVPLESITGDIVVSDHVPGTGRSFGALAIEVLHEVRAS